MIVIFSRRLQHRLQLGRICSKYGHIEVFATEQSLFSYMRKNNIKIVILAGLPSLEYQSVIETIRAEKILFSEILVFEEFVTISKPQILEWEIKCYLGSPKKNQEIEDWIENAIRGNYAIIQNTHPSRIRKYLFQIYNHIRRRL
jgi:DNA-binding NarL/FixJ family response regulator